MSLIIDATKVAQREKDRRDAGLRNGPVPVLVPLRSTERERFPWGRIAMVSSGVVVLAVGAWFALDLTRNAVPRSLAVPGPTVLSLVNPPPVDPAATTRTDSLPTKEVARIGKVDSAPAAIRPAAIKPPTRTRPVRRVNPAPSSLEGLRVTVEPPRRNAEASDRFARAVSAHRAGDLAGARTGYESVLAIAPNDPDALNNMGVLLLGMREFEVAESVLRRAVAGAPGSADAWSNLGTALRERGRSSEAIAAFQHALAIDRNHVGASVSLAQQYLMIGSLVPARRILEGVLASLPTSPEASYALGQVLERQGDRGGAIRAYSVFVRVAPPALAPYADAVRKRIDALASQPPN